MKIFIVIIFLIVSISFNFGLTNTKNKFGCLIGKIQLTTDRRFWDLKEGTYNDKIAVFIKDLNTNSIYRSHTNNGFFIFYDLPVGNYQVIKWQFDIQTGNGITVFLLNEIKDYNFTIEKNKITSLKYLSIKAEIPKDFTYKVNYFYNFSTLNINELKKVFFKKDKKEIYASYLWQELSENKIETVTDQNVLIKQFISSSENDYSSIENLYKSGDYDLAFMLFYRIEDSLLKAIYIRLKNSSIPKVINLKDFAKELKIELKPEQYLLLHDLSLINDKIKSSSNDTKFLVTKEYFDSYKGKLNELRFYLKAQLPNY